MGTRTNSSAPIEVTDRGSPIEPTLPPKDADSPGAGEPGDATGPARLGHHTLLYELGRGGMGVVYAAHDERLERRVAIKLLRRHGDASVQQRMLQEARALARLSHPHVVQIYELGVVDGQTFIAMEFVEGPTLRQWLAERPRSRREVLALFMTAGRGLAAAHEVGLIHRDFKPDNVMLRRDGRVLVMDFGLARGVRFQRLAESSAGIEPSQGGSMRPSATIGSPGYMSPEQFGGRELDMRADVFSFCVSLWEALYGARPFVGERQSDVEDAILRGERTEPRPSNVPAWLRTIMLRGLECEPNRRWGTMDELLAALGRDPTARRRALLAKFGVALALLAVGVGIGVTLERGRALSAMSAEHASTDSGCATRARGPARGD